MKPVKFNGISLEEWFDCLVLNVLPYEVYLKHSKEGTAWLVLNYWYNSKPRSWGWSWGSWLSWVFDGNEFYMDLSYEEQEELDQALYDYIEKLAEKVDENRETELKKTLEQLLYR
jgi:hypothetical protein